MKKIFCLIMLLMSVFLAQGQDLNQYNSIYDPSQTREAIHGRYIGEYVAQNQSGQSRLLQLYQRSDGYYVEIRGIKGAYYAYNTGPIQLCANILGVLWCFVL